MTSPISSTVGKTLAIETSGSAGSLSLGLFDVEWKEQASSSEVVTLKLEELCAKAELEVGSIQSIVVNVGPGSFTGIRVGVNVARSLGFLLNIPILALTSLELLAFRESHEGEQITIGLKAIRDLFYVATFEHAKSQMKCLAQPHSLELNQLKASAQSSTKVRVEGETSNFSAQLHSRILLKYLDHWPSLGRFYTWRELKPIYVRGSEAEEKLLKGLLKT